MMKDFLTARFQSTPSVGRATLQPKSYPKLKDISIHALRGEGDQQEQERKEREAKFQSTPSVGRATNSLVLLVLLPIFQSTPSVGRATQKPKKQAKKIRDFNPRPPWGGRLCCQSFILNESPFQSTPSVGRATQRRKQADTKSTISIHALRGEGDCKNIQICNAMLVHSAYKTIYFCNSCAFYLA